MPVQTDSQWSLPETLQELAGDSDGEVVRDILASFQSDTSSRLQQLQHALEGSDRATIRLHAHAIKGSAVQVGADGVAAVCRALESAAPHRPAADLADLLVRAQTCFDQVSRAMDRFQQAV